MDKTKFLKLGWAFGKVVQKPLQDRARVLVQLNRLNEILLMYFPEKHTLDVYDQARTSRVGDLVLLKKLDEPIHNFDTHEIKEIVYPVGAIVDPISGLRVARDRYLFDTEALDEESHRNLAKAVEDHEFSPKYMYEIKEKELMTKEVLGKKYGTEDD